MFGKVQNVPIFTCTCLVSLAGCCVTSLLEGVVITSSYKSTPSPWKSPPPSPCQNIVVDNCLWRSHWASMLRWIGPILEGLPEMAPWKVTCLLWERRGSGPETEKPKHNPYWPVGRNWGARYVCRFRPNDHVMMWFPERRENTGTCLQCVWQGAKLTFKLLF